MAQTADKPIPSQTTPSPAAAGAAPLPAAWANLLAFLASGAILVLELIAGRMLAPYIGVSLYTWTSIIGVCLAGISIGNWLGGRLADSRPPQAGRTLGLLFLAGGLATLATLPLAALFGGSGLFRELPLLARIFVLTTLVFFLPCLLLSMATPVIIRLSLADVRRTGRLVGMVYAFGTLGSLVGNFLTGFVLTAFLPVTAIVLAVGATMLALGGVVWATTGSLSPTPDPHPSPLPGGEGVPVRSTLHAPRSTLHAPRSTLSLRGNLPLACAVVIVSSFCTMAIELAASRILAPSLGLSLYSWTGIFGTVLAGIAVGNYLGGRLADRWPDQRVLGLSLFLGGLGTFYVLLLTGVLETEGLLVRMGLMERIVAVTAVIFFLPVLLLGTISPQVIRLAVTDLRHAGRVSGQIYAWSTGGAIVGTFLTGWWLISAIGVHALVFAMGVILLGLAIVVGRFWRHAAALGAALAVTVGAIWWLVDHKGLESTCTLETNYFCIRVREDVRDGSAVRTLVLDHLIHSYVKLGDPSYLGYEHEYVQAEVTRYAIAKTGRERALVIGGGGYTYPRWVEWAMPSALVEVVEIDPGVTEVVHTHLGLPRDTRIQSYNLDGRQFVHENAPKGAYALVVQDAVNDLSVPYHIMTREYNDQVRALLAPNGAYLLTVIDLFEDGQLLRAAVRTMMQTFPSVQLLAAGQPWNGGGAAVWVVAGSEQGIDLEDMRRVLREQGLGFVRTQALEPARLQAYVAQGPQIVLTDEYAPVDNLIAIIFRRRAGQS